MVLGVFGSNVLRSSKVKEQYLPFLMLPFCLNLLQKSADSLHVFAYALRTYAQLLPFLSPLDATFQQLLGHIEGVLK